MKLIGLRLMPIGRKGQKELNGRYLMKSQVWENRERENY